MKKELINIDMKEKIIAYIYLLGIFLLNLKFFLEKNELFKINDNIIAVIMCLCFFQKMIFQKYNRKQRIVTVISGLISTYVAFITKEYIVFYLFLALFASKDIEIEKIIKISFCTILTLISICTIIYVVKLLCNIEVPIDVRNDGKIRYTFYLNHPNMYAGVVLWLTSMIMYIKYNTIKIRDYGVIIFINILIFYVTNSRTSIITFIFLLVVFITCKKGKKFHKHFFSIAKYSFLFFGCVTIGLTCIYILNKDNQIISKLNEIFSQRIFLFAASINKYGVSLFARNIDLTEAIRWESGTMKELFIDSIYARAFIKYGIIYLVYLSFICINLINKKTTIKEVPFVILFSTVGMMEKYIIFPVIGFPLFFFIKYLWNTESIGVNEIERPN